MRDSYCFDEYGTRVGTGWLSRLWIWLFGHHRCEKCGRKLTGRYTVSLDHCAMGTWLYCANGEGCREGRGD